MICRSSAFKALLMGGVAFGGVVLSTESWAQAAPSQGSASNPAVITVEEIVVTATKSRQRLIDVPVSITAESGEQLRRRGATQLQDLVATTPGLSNPGQGGGNKTNLVIRGVTTDMSANLKQSTVSVLFDDIPVDPSTAGLLTTNLRLVDIERVEVLRGPQGTLFGSGSLSGAVRYITNKPDASAFSGSIEGSYAGTKSGADSKWGNVVLNVPLVTDRVAVRAVGYDFSEGGWIDNIRTKQNNVNRTRTYGGRVALEAKATDQMEVTLTGAYQKGHDTASGGSLYTQPAGYSTQVNDGRAGTQSYVKSALANLGVTYDFGNVTLFSSSTYINRKVDILEDFGYYAEYLQAIYRLPALNTSAPGKTYGHSDIYQQEVRLASNGDGPFRWTAGGFYLKSKTPEGGQMITAAGLAPYLGTGNLADVRSPGSQEEIAGFGQAVYSVADKLDITAGLRVSRTTLDINSISSGILMTGGTNVVTFKLPSRDTTYNPRVSVLYRPTSQLSLYAQAARGYRVGGANLTAGLGGPGIPLTYSSDSLWNYEAGAKASLMDGRLQINGDVYYIDWSDIQVSLVSNNINYTGNAGSARIYGFELEVAARPTSWLDLGGSLSLSDGALTQDAPTLVRTTGIVGAKDGDRLPGSSKSQGSAYAQFNFRLQDNRAYIRASGQYVGSGYTDFDEQGVRFGDYATFDLRGGVIYNNVEFTLFARNLLDSDGVRAAAEASRLGPIVVNARYAYRVRPRTVGLTARVGF